MKNKKESKSSMKTLDKMKELRTDNEAGKMGHEDGNSEKSAKSLKKGAGTPEKAEASNPGHVENGEHLKHSQVRPLNKHTLTNDTAYFLHHPQIKPHGPSMPPQKPKGK